MLQEPNRRYFSAQVFSQDGRWCRPLRLTSFSPSWVPPPPPCFPLPTSSPDLIKSLIYFNHHLLKPTCSWLMQSKRSPPPQSPSLSYPLSLTHVGFKSIQVQSSASVLVQNSTVSRVFCPSSPGGWVLVVRSQLLVPYVLHHPASSALSSLHFLVNFLVFKSHSK